MSLKLSLKIEESRGDQNFPEFYPIEIATTSGVSMLTCMYTHLYCSSGYSVRRDCIEVL